MGELKSTIYHSLVNRISGIRLRYHQYRLKNPGSLGRIKAWCYLCGLNLQYYLFRREELGLPAQYGYYETKRLAREESFQAFGQKPKELARRLLAYDVITFDVFDTLIFRPFSCPSDLFFFVGIRLGYRNFAQLRREAEGTARKEHFERTGNWEVTFEEIWEVLSRQTGIDKEIGMNCEWETELQFCFPNPYFREVLKILSEEGKTLVAASDMYLERKKVEKLLEKNGILVFRQVFVSSEEGSSKQEGTLYERIRTEYGKEKRYAHVGDGTFSDVRMAGKHGFHPFWYPNVQEEGNHYRPMDMSAITGSMYRGLVNIRLHSQCEIYPMLYEYGYVYGGLLALGYCQFIHRFVREHGITRILFLARDGDILKQVYERLYPEETTVYVFWSRAAALKLCADYDKQDFFRRFLFHKVNQGYTQEQIFESMELSDMLEGFLEECSGKAGEEFTEKRAGACREYLLGNWEKVLSHYREQQKAAGTYFTGILKNVKKAAAVDIGWAGSGALALKTLVREEWKLDTEVYALIAGTNTWHNAEPDTSEGFFFTGQMESYLFSQRHNRDLWKFHNLNRDHNIYLEMLFASPTPSFKGFALSEEGKLVFRFGEQEQYPEKIRQIQTGILDFVEDWKRFFGSFKEEGWGTVSGRDAYAPVLCMLEDVRYQKALKKECSWNTNRNVE